MSRSYSCVLPILISARRQVGDERLGSALITVQFESLMEHPHT